MQASIGVRQTAMGKKKREHRKAPASPVFIISGGMGASGEQLVRTALAQFESDVSVEIVSHVRRIEQIEDVVTRAAAAGGTIVHTLVNADLRRALTRLARDRNVVAIDLMGRLLSRLANVLKREPIGQPGLYRQMREDYFERIEAIEFTVAHDDGRETRQLHMAEIVLVGVSRVGKTPLSMYLSVLGWKVASVPLFKDISPPEELFKIDARRVVGLTIDPKQLVVHRRLRSRRIGVGPGTSYTHAAELTEELKAVRRLCRQNGFPLVDVTDKPIEESADEVISLVSRRLEGQSG